MKILIKLIFTGMLMLNVISNAQAFYDQDDIDSSLIIAKDNSPLTFSITKDNDDLEALNFPSDNTKITSLTSSLTDTDAPYQVGSLFSNKNFSAESGFSEKSTKQIEQKSYFLQGRYRVLQQERFSLLITAKIESLNQHSIYQFYSNDFVSNEKSSIPVNASNAYARIGILGKYAINKHWSLVGGVTSTAHDKSSSAQPINHKKTDQVALFGTTYTF